MKTYRFTDNTYWFSNGCDCCEDFEMPTFNSDDTDPNLGSAYSLEDCYGQAIVSSLGGLGAVTDEERDEIWQMDIDQLKEMAESMCIRVEMI